MRLVHLSDIHVWDITWKLRHWRGKRIVGLLDLLRGRAGKFRLEHLPGVVEQVQKVGFDHLLITGDLTTTALPDEFRRAREALAPLLIDPARVSVVPGNHDRYTRDSVRDRTFERSLGDLMPSTSFPWLRWLGPDTAILGLDPTRSHLSARGWMPPDQLDRARSLVAEARPKRLIVACHYPVAAAPGFERELARKRLSNPSALREWLRTLGPHLFCCGHVHAAWAYRHPDLPTQIGLNAGAPLLASTSPRRRPGFLAIDLEGPSVRVTHHARSLEGDWSSRVLIDEPSFF
jgi:3',5'-cyclic AMP phosphodiesterase CpdA